MTRMMTPASSGLAPKIGGCGILDVQVVQHRHRLEHHVVAVLQDGQRGRGGSSSASAGTGAPACRNAASCDSYGRPLCSERQQHAPGKRTAAAPVKSDCHGRDCSGADAVRAAAALSSARAFHDSHRCRPRCNRCWARPLSWSSTAASTSPHPTAGRRAYLRGHIPTRALCRSQSRPVRARCPPRPAATRCPPPVRLAALFGALGIGSETQVVAYDEVNGSLAARAVVAVALARAR